ncbi:MAG: 50S ribosomal protein L25 [Verrucomicrobiales bacterium]
MAQNHALSATHRRRSGSGALKAMRREGLVPAVIYGKSEPAQNIKVNAREFATLLKDSASEHILVDLDLEGSKKLAILQDIQHDPISGGFVHIDFHAVSANETVHAQVSVEIRGESPGLKMGGMVEVLVHELDVACLPKDLPETFLIDVSNLELGGTIHVSELVLPQGVKVEMDPSLVVVHVTEPKVAVEEVAAAAGPAEPEVLREKKPAEQK